MKKITALLSATALGMSAVTVGAADIGDVIGTVYHTDIVAYINNYAIPSYAANGTSVVVAEDLREYGFDVEWNDDLRRLTITRNSDALPRGMEFTKNGVPSTAFTDMLYTDIEVYADGVKIPSYAINGWTMIPLESLTMFGGYVWDNDSRTLKLTVDGLGMRDDTQSVDEGLQYSRSPIDDEGNLLPTMSEGEKNEINEFLTAFTEIGFSVYDEEAVVDDELIYFGCMHNARNNLYGYAKFEDGSCVGAEAVDDTLMRYFGKTVSHKSAKSTNLYGDWTEQAYGNGYYVFDFSEDTIYNSDIAVADAVYENYGGTYTVTFGVYRPDGVGGTERIADAKAIVRPYDDNGRSTYQMVRYWK